ncbi:hypothetical protein L249_8342 [Ophiocordyceps polyrhachis-furcata BCC 54312]|uniref:N-acetyltransferase domain-containing protein n=1 Tax=Ophiocordyceps polyrhachis-furcata BCC 54312 TaxID=1330021 RepID=A0A367KZB6_9HYPO|nr:hypothetical protein L249_4490 [Ophiocordyceps polyrhachis-furcata BCC 54312]RCI07358.1 hypothetical protein L249_6202 [Ophiocordyceps polyrhachis-furcata BCC 54312]RCI07519.1 hypothetical protein L249_8341 [Ophiocordyceps polyrhachis-furcata BCC 54312]RCI07520.1 hypothetical protein L249_8342 [Ophiocordyceps polyrhachis-furcata BCC 54312]
MFITVSTTLPVLKRKNLNFPIVTERLIIRPFVRSDLEAYYSFRSQPEGMRHSRRGVPDANIGETQARLEKLLEDSPDTVAYCGVFLKKSDNSEGELIGDGGMWDIRSEQTGWPVLGFKSKKEHWGKGYGTEFTKAYMEFWWEIERTVEEISVESASLVAPEFQVKQVTEQMYAWTTKDNTEAQKVLQKAGFKSWEGLDTGLVNWRMENPSLTGFAGKL